jgi:hypothetical protein
MFLGLLDPDPDPSVKGMNPDPDPASDPDPSHFFKGVEQTEIMLAK